MGTARATHSGSSSWNNFQSIDTVLEIESDLIRIREVDEGFFPRKTQVSARYLVGGHTDGYSRVSVGRCANVRNPPLSHIERNRTSVSTLLTRLACPRLADTPLLVPNLPQIQEKKLSQITDTTITIAHMEVVRIFT